MRVTAEYIAAKRERMQELLRAGVTGVTELRKIHGVPRDIISRYYLIDRKKLIEVQKISREIVSDQEYPFQDQDLPLHPGNIEAGRACLAK